MICKLAPFPAQLCRGSGGAIFVCWEPGLGRVHYEFQFLCTNFKMFVRHPPEMSGKQVNLKGSVCGGGMYTESCQHPDDKATGRRSGGSIEKRKEKGLHEHKSWYGGVTFYLLSSSCHQNASSPRAWILSFLFLSFGSWPNLYVWRQMIFRFPRCLSQVVPLSTFYATVIKIFCIFQLPNDFLKGSSNRRDKDTNREPLDDKSAPSFFCFSILVKVNKPSFCNLWTRKSWLNTIKHNLSPILHTNEGWPEGQVAMLYSGTKALPIL